MEQICAMCARKQVTCLHIIPLTPVSFLCPPSPVPTGMFAIRAEREYVESEDLMKAVRKVSDTKKLESKMDYKQI